MKYFRYTMMNIFTGCMITCVLIVIVSLMQTYFPYQLEDDYTTFDVYINDADSQEVQNLVKHKIEEFITENPDTFLAVNNDEFYLEKIHDGRVLQDTEEFFRYNRWEGHYTVGKKLDEVSALREIPDGIFVDQIRVHAEKYRGLEGIQRLLQNRRFIDMIIGLIFAYFVYCSSVHLMVINKENKIAVLYLLGASRRDVLWLALRSDWARMLLEIGIGSLMAGGLMAYEQIEKSMLWMLSGCVLTLLLNKSILALAIRKNFRKFQKGELTI